MTSSTVKFKWTKIKQDTFNGIIRIMTNDTLLAYRDFNEEFKIHNNASNSRLGAVIIQNVKPVDLYSRKLTGA